MKTLRKKKRSLFSSRQVAYLMAAGAMLQYTVSTPESIWAKDLNTEDPFDRKGAGKPDRWARGQNDPFRRDDPWRPWDGSREQSVPPPKQRLFAQLSDKDMPVTFNIAPQSLITALDQFGEQADVQFAYTSEDIKSVETGGVTGTHTREDALSLLLAKTGIQYRVTGPNTITLEKRTGADAADVGAGLAAGAVSAGVVGAVAAQGESGVSDGSSNGAQSKPVKVPEIVVKDVVEKTPAVDMPDGYKADVSSEAVLRFPAPIQELPQSVSVVTRDSMRERRAVTQTEALEGVAGFTKTPQFGGGFDQYVIRGFGAELSSPGYSRDNGLSAFNNYVADPTLYDRIEVIKGAASFTSGLVAAGGFVNRLLKAPVKDNFIVGEAFAGSDGHYRTTLDANGVMPTIPQLSGRFVFVQNQDPEFFQNSGNQRFSFLPSVRLTTDNDFTLTLTGNVQRVRGKGYFGTPTNTEGRIPAGIQDSLLGSGNTLKLDYQSAHIEAEKKFAQGFRLKAKGQYSHSSMSYRYAYGYQSGGIGPDGNFGIYAYGQDMKQESWVGEVNLVKEFSLFGNLSSVAAGMDYAVGRLISKGTGASLGAGNLSSPDVNVPFPPGFTDPITNLKRDLSYYQTGAFVQGLLRPFAGTTVMVALRGNWLTQDANASFVGAAGDQVGLNKSKLTPQVGVSQRLIEGLNVYASYGESFQPNFAITSSGSLLDPVTGKTVEVGSKWEPLGPRLLLTAALFRTELDNVAVPDPAFPPNAGFSIGGQSQRNQGFEFEARGALTPQLQINLAYTYLDAKITQSTITEIVGAPPWNVPHNTVSAFGSYDFSQLLTKGLKLGAVAYYRSQVSSFPFPNLSLGQTYEGYARADLFAIYAPFTWLTLQLNLNNLFDARYVEGPNRYGAFNQFGAPRHVIGMLRMTF